MTRSASSVYIKGIVDVGACVDGIVYVVVLTMSVLLVYRLDECGCANASSWDVSAPGFDVGRCGGWYKGRKAFSHAPPAHDWRGKNATRARTNAAPPLVDLLSEMLGREITSTWQIERKSWNEGMCQISSNENSTLSIVHFLDAP